MTYIPQMKNYHIETLRGLAILLVVAGHVIGSAPTGGMKIDFPSPWRYLYLWIDYIQMPLFTAIAGWVYALKPVTKNSLRLFIKKKSARLLLPMITVGTLYFLIQYITPGTNNKGELISMWKIYIFPYTIYWYLPSLFLIFLFVAFIDIHGWGDKFKDWYKWFILAYILLICEKLIIPHNIPNLFSFKGALNQLPYFIIGMGVKRFSYLLLNSQLKKLYWGIALIGMVGLQIEWFYPSFQFNLYNCLKPFFVIATLLLLLPQSHTNHILVWIGKYAYTIYLFHVFGTAGGRIILTKLGIHSEIFIFIIAFNLAVFLPILIDKLFNHFKLTRLIFLGKLNKMSC
ncbi:acyltransferase family protein [Parabacteroides pacaensis]|uniref:acyltransferase family protein n=1 Tax=Parabacteroides pacaensis TaxID=2086575 RepID=UPI001F2DD555|nr:acyltransferase [Parabacteroides pacaensis]